MTTIEAKCGCPADASGGATIVVHHNAKCALLPWPASGDESLANVWKGWPEAAREYRGAKHEQVERLTSTNNALHDAVRSRDALLLDAAKSIEQFLEWWWSDDIDGSRELLAELGRVAGAARALLRT